VWTVAYLKTENKLKFKRIRERSNIMTLQAGRGFAQTVRVPSYEGEEFGQIVI